MGASYARDGARPPVPVWTDRSSSLHNVDDLDLFAVAGRIWALVRRRIWILASTVATTALGTGALAILLPPSYTATATVMVEPSTPRLSGLADDGAIGSWNEYLQSQICVLDSYAVAALACTKFAGADDATDPQDDPVESFRKTVLVRRVKGSRLIHVSVTADTPEEAAKRANGLVDAYAEHRLDARRGSSQQAYSWLTTQISNLKAKVEESESALLALVRQEGQLSIDTQQRLLVSRIETLERNLATTKVRRIELEATLGELAEMKGSPSLQHALPENALTEVARTLIAELTKNEQELAECLRELRPQHPRAARLRAAIEIGRARLDTELAEIIGGIEAAHRITCVSQEKTQSDLQKLKAEALRLAELSIRHDVLEREVTSNREMYELLLAKLRQSDVGGQVTIDNISTVDRARPPIRPDSGLTARKLLVALVVGLALGLGLCQVAEMLSGSASGNRQSCDNDETSGIDPASPPLRPTPNPATGRNMHRSATSRRTRILAPCSIK